MIDREGTLPVPKALRLRPVWRGFPVPYIALSKPDGTSDFRVVDEQKRVDVMRRNRCQLCGVKLGATVFFVAGIAATFHNQFWEPGMHLECLLFAMQTCPFIVGKVDHADIADTQARNPGVKIGPDSTYSNLREPIWIITKAGGYTLYRPPHVLAHADPILARWAGEPDKVTAAGWLAIRENLLAA